MSTYGPWEAEILHRIQIIETEIQRLKDWGSSFGLTEAEAELLVAPQRDILKSLHTEDLPLAKAMDEAQKGKSMLVSFIELYSDNRTRNGSREIAINSEEVASVHQGYLRMGDTSSIIKMRSGDRYEVVGTVQQVTEKLQGDQA